MNSYRDMLEGLTAAFRTLPALTTVLVGPPTTVQTGLLLWTEFGDFSREDAGQLVKQTYHLRHTVVGVIQDYAQAEALLSPLIEQIPALIDADPQLGGRLTTGYARILNARGDYWEISGQVCRGVEFVSECFVKGPRG